MLRWASMAVFALSLAACDGSNCDSDGNCDTDPGDTGDTSDTADTDDTSDTDTDDTDTDTDRRSWPSLMQPLDRWSMAANKSIKCQNWALRGL